MQQQKSTLGITITAGRLQILVKDSITWSAFTQSPNKTQKCAESIVEKFWQCGIERIVDTVFGVFVQNRIISPH
jgi:hypothetical protein